MEYGQPWALISCKHRAEAREADIANKIRPSVEAELKREFYKKESKRIRKQLIGKMKGLERIKDRKLSFVPKNEQGVVLLFGRFYDVLGFSEILSVSTGCPDCVALKNGRKVRIEMEYDSSNFIAHGHKAEDVDLVVCWKCGGVTLPVPVLELKEELTGIAW